VPVLVVGSPELVQVLTSLGHSPLAPENWEQAKAVVVGVDPDFSYNRLRAAARAVDAGAAFFAINLDARFPVGPGLFDPGCGSLSEAIAIAGGKRPVPVGKPERALFQVAIARLRCQANQAAMVGDSTASDIRGGRAAGMFTIWLSPEGDVNPPDSVDLEVKDLAELHRLWQDARAVSRRS
jgi:4-nitrophenyl phosphatase